MVYVQHTYFIGSFFWNVDIGYYFVCCITVPSAISCSSHSFSGSNYRKWILDLISLMIILLLLVLFLLRCVLTSCCCSFFRWLMVWFHQMFKFIINTLIHPIIENPSNDSTPFSISFCLFCLLELIHPDYMYNNNYYHSIRLTQIVKNMKRKNDFIQTTNRYELAIARIS